MIRKPRRRKPRPPEPKVNLCVRGFDPVLRAAIKEQARAEGILIGEWLERAVTRELAHSRQLQSRAEGASAS